MNNHITQLKNPLLNRNSDKAIYEHVLYKVAPKKISGIFMAPAYLFSTLAMSVLFFYTSTVRDSYVPNSHALVYCKTEYSCTQELQNYANKATLFLSQTKDVTHEKPLLMSLHSSLKKALTDSARNNFIKKNNELHDTIATLSKISDSDIKDIDMKKYVLVMMTKDQ